MSKKKIVLIRLDKIGDLICTLAVDQILNPNDYEVTWIVQKNLGQVVDLGAKKRNYFELDKQNQKLSSQKLSEILKAIKPDIAISFQAPWWVNCQLFKARIPIRSGVKSQWHSFLFLNQGIRQKRSQALKHEFNYNLDLVLQTLKLKETKQFSYFEIPYPADTSVVTKFNLTSKKYIVVHPGMMGSALNWPSSKYIALIRKQILAGKKVVLTGTDEDEAYLVEIKKEFSKNPSFINLQSKLKLKELVQILAHSEFVVAPSTGVAHLAASVGATLHAIYSPIQVHQPQRWAARGPKVKIYTPQIKCPAVHVCLKEKCIHYDCMGLIQVNP